MKKEIIWVAAGQILTALGALIVLRLATELLMPDEYGEFALKLTVCALVTQVFLGGVNAAGSRYFAVATTLGQVTQYLNVLIKHTDRVVVVCVLIAVVTVFAKINYENSEMIIWIFVLIFSLVASVNSIINGVINSARKRATSTLFQASEIWLRIPLLFILLQYEKNNLIEIFLVYLITSIVVAILQRRYLMVLIASISNSVNSTSSEPWEWKIIKYALPYIPWTFLIWVQQVSDRWALDYFVDSQAVGIYAVALQVGFSSVLMLFTIGIRFIQPIMYLKTDNKNLRDWGGAGESYVYRLTVIGSSMGSILFIMAMIFHQQVFAIMVSAEFDGYSYLLPWMVLSAVLFGISEIFAMKMQSDMRTTHLSITKCYLGFIGITLTVLGSIFGGLNGVVAALVTFNIVNLLIMAISANVR